MTSEPLAAQGQIPEMENLFEEATVKAVIKKASPQSAAGPFRLDYATAICRLRCAMKWSRFSRRLRRLFFHPCFAPNFWTLHTSANLSSLGQKARLVAYGDVLQRVSGAVFCRRYGRKLADYFQWGQYSVAFSGGVEIMAFTATLGFEEGCTILSYDGANAFNSIYRHRFLPALAEIVP